MEDHTTAQLMSLSRGLPEAASRSFFRYEQQHEKFWDHLMFIMR